LIPQYDQLWGTVVETPELYGKVSDPWDDNGYGLDMQAARRLVTNTWRKGRVSPEQFLAEPQCWATLDYSTLESPNVHAELTWSVMREGTAHGLSLWFDSYLAEGISYSNSPTEIELIYGNAFFPLTNPVRLSAGDTVSVNLSAYLVGDEYVWSWNTRVLGGGEVKADFKQSTFFAEIVSPEQLRKKSTKHIPALSTAGQGEHLILSLIDGQRTLDEIARLALERFPGHFRNRQESLTRCSELSQKYSR